MRNWRKRTKEKTGAHDKKISVKIDANKAHFAKNHDVLPGLVVREITLYNGRKGLISYVENISDTLFISQQILKPLFSDHSSEKSIQNVLTVPKIDELDLWEEVHAKLLLGFCLIFIDGETHVYCINSQNVQKRTPSEPANERTIRGSHQGFIEFLDDNLAMLRRYLPNDQFRVQKVVIGSETRTKAAIVYLEELANPDVIEELMSRIDKVKDKSILDVGELEQRIEDNPYTVFPQFLSTERPDSVVSDLLQGRIAILVDKSPNVLVGPSNFNSFFQSIDDYSSRWIASSFIRLLRFICFIIAVFLPALYIAVISYHYEILPLEMLLSIGQSRREVPFPPIIEALLMEFILEMLREAGLRLPKSIGQTVGIVGGLIIGQSAVEAGLVSNIMVIVVAMTAIASFVMPNPEMAFGIRFIRFPMMAISSFFGMVGIIIGFMILIMHLLSLESLGTAYGAPYAPLSLKGLKDSIIRFPISSLNKIRKSPRA
ncbi:MAG: spore germination protein [Anaerobacillus sp.]